MTRPFRFGLQASFASTGQELRDLARRAEASGYSTLTIADHLGIVDPFVACAVAAECTDELRVATNVLNIDFHQPALLARAVATIDLMSDGRFELGLGAGHMRSEYESADLRYDRPGRRITRVADTIAILRQLFAGETVTFEGEERSVHELELSPLPPQGSALPIVVGGNGTRLLQTAARLADIVGFVGFSHDGRSPIPSHMTGDGLDDRVAVVRAAIPEGSERELQALVQRAVVTNNAASAANQLADDVRFLEGNPDAVFDCPFLLVGSVDEITDRLVERRERFGVSYWVFFAHQSSPEIDEVVGRLAGS